MRRSLRAVVALVAVASVALLVGCSHASSKPPLPRGAPRDKPRSVRTTSLGAGRAASRVVFWTGCKDVVGLSDAQLDEWHRRGAGGFVCVFQHLADLGGDQSFTADPKSSLAGTQYDLQRQIRDSKIVDRARARGIKLWLGFYLSNAVNRRSPLEDWFDDTAWTTQLIPRIADVGGRGQERSASRAWRSTRSRTTAAAGTGTTRATHTASPRYAPAVRKRGAQMMKAIVGAFPGVDLIDYGTYFPDGWNALVQEQINHEQRPVRELGADQPLERAHQRARIRPDPVHGRDVLQDRPSRRRDVGQRDDVQRQPADGVLQPQPDQLGVRVQPHQRVSVRVDRRRRPERRLLHCAAPARVRRRSARRVPQVGHGRRLRACTRTAASRAASTTAPTLPGCRPRRDRAWSTPGRRTWQSARSRLPASETIVSGTATDDMVIRSVLCRSGAHAARSIDDVVGDRRERRRGLPLAHRLDRHRARGVCTADHVHRIRCGEQHHDPEAQRLGTPLRERTRVLSRLRVATAMRS